MQSTDIKLHFLGAAGTVTGSKYVLEYKNKLIMVDCGLFQGLKNLRLRNWEPLPIDPSRINYLLLTHAHLDHTGYIPKLVKSGFSGPVMGNAPTLALTEIILRDSAKIQEEEAEEANQRGYSRHKPAKPLYITRDVENSLRQFRVIQNNEWIRLSDEIKCRFRTNGHILGACFIEIDINGKRIVFSGDIGTRNDPLLFDPRKPDKADVVLIESTYGNRLHPSVNPLDELDAILKEVKNENRVLIIPSFAVERTQLLMYMFTQLRLSKGLYGLPVYMDSPMGNKVIEAFITYGSWQKLTESQWMEIFSSINFISSVEESRDLVKDSSSKIVLAGSGMASGGRVLSYLEKYVSNPTATILLVGYQAAGTRGRQMLDGAHEIKIKGQYYPVKAKIQYLPGLSAHADQKGLLDWLSEIKGRPEKVFIVHGEPEAADMLRVKICDRYNWNTIIPGLGDFFTL
jgi:metallo-beta-lactamase family protein